MSRFGMMRKDSTLEKDLKILKELYGTSQITVERLKMSIDELEETVYDLTSLLSDIKVFIARMYATNKKSKVIKELAEHIIKVIDESKHKDKF